MRRYNKNKTEGKKQILETEQERLYLLTFSKQASKNPLHYIQS
jgi:hypothetical protein